MSPPPVRVETNASSRPSGENSGRRSLAGSATSSRASPPLAGTVQMSPPDVNAISRPSGEMPGSANAYLGAAEGGGVCAESNRPAAPADSERDGGHEGERQSHVETIGAVRLAFNPRVV